MKKTYLFSMLSLILFSCTKVEFSEFGIKDAFILAESTKKKVFIVVGSDDCKRCEKYVQSLNKDSDAKKILNEEFICLKVNQDENSGREFSQITGCAFFPYSCFFDHHGNLLNIRIGDKAFDFNNIEGNAINIYTYRELFNLPVSFEAYKKRVSLSMKSWLMRSKENQSKPSIEKALMLCKQSIEIHPYPYNLYAATTLARVLNDTLFIKKYQTKFKEIYTPYDDFLFSDLRTKLGVSLGGYISPKKNPNIDYKFSKDLLNLGRLKYKSKEKFKCEITNTGKQPLIIKLARASCSCADLEWTKKPIMPNEKGFVKGVFHAKKKGRFYKQIFIHLSSKVVPMSTVGIQGFVEKN